MYYSNSIDVLDEHAHVNYHLNYHLNHYENYHVNGYDYDHRQIYEKLFQVSIKNKWLQYKQKLSNYNC
jgi:hypothetical protein